MSHAALLGAVLAGGRSTRMGTCKSELPHPSGGTFLDHAITQLSGCCEHVACSLAARSAASTPVLPDDVHAIFDTIPDSGPAEGVCRAVDLAKTIGCTGVLVMAVDLPALDTAHLQRLVAKFWESSDRAVVAISDDTTADKRLQPLVAIYPVSMQDDLRILARSASRGLYRFLAGCDYVAVELPAAVLHNVNLPDDLL